MPTPTLTISKSSHQAPSDLSRSRSSKMVLRTLQIVTALVVLGPVLADADGLRTAAFETDECKGQVEELEQLRIELAKEMGAKEAYEQLLDKLESRRFKAEETARSLLARTESAESRATEAKKKLEEGIAEATARLRTIEQRLVEEKERTLTAAKKVAQLERERESLKASLLVEQSRTAYDKFTRTASGYYSTAQSRTKAHAERVQRALEASRRTLRDIAKVTEGRGHETRLYARSWMESLSDKAARSEHLIAEIQAAAVAVLTAIFRTGRLTLRWFTQLREKVVVSLAGAMIVVQSLKPEALAIAGLVAVTLLLTVRMLLTRTFGISSDEIRQILLPLALRSRAAASATTPRRTAAAVADDELRSPTIHSPEAVDNLQGGYGGSLRRRRKPDDGAMPSAAQLRFMAKAEDEHHVR